MTPRRQSASIAGRTGARARSTDFGICTGPETGCGFSTCPGSWSPRAHGVRGRALTLPQGSRGINASFPSPRRARPATWPIKAKLLIFGLISLAAVAARFAPNAAAQPRWCWTAKLGAMCAKGINNSQSEPGIACCPGCGRGVAGRAKRA